MTGWHSFRATQALTVLGLLCSMANAVSGFVARVVSTRGTPFLLALILSGAAFVFILLGMAAFAGIDRSFHILKTTGSYTYGAGFGLCIVCWLLQLTSCACYIVGRRYDVIGAQQKYQPAN